MKGISELLLVVITLVVLLVAAILLITVFGNYLGQGGNVIGEGTIRAACQLKAQQLCGLQTTGQANGWDGQVVLQGTTYTCSSYGVTGSCSQTILGGGSSLKASGASCVQNSECQSGVCNGGTSKCT